MIVDYTSHLKTSSSQCIFQTVLNKAFIVIEEIDELCERTALSENIESAL